MGNFDGETNLVDIKFKKINLNSNAIINFGMWDFSGKQDSIRIRTELYQEFQAIAYCFDVSNRGSFSSVENWMKEVKKYGGEKLIPVCLGLKSDLSKSVDNGTINSFCQKNNMTYFEISTKNSGSVKKFFYEFGNALYESLKKKK